MNINLGGQILQLGKNPLVKNTLPIPLNVSWGAYSGTVGESRVFMKVN